MEPMEQMERDAEARAAFEREIKIAYPDSPRVGKFRVINEKLVDGRERPLLQALFGLCVVLGMEDPDETGRGKMYYAASELFQALSEGEQIPEYRIECSWPDSCFTNPEHEKDFVQAQNGFRFRAVRQNIVRVPPLEMSLRPNVTRH